MRSKFDENLPQTSGFYGNSFHRSMVFTNRNKFPTRATLRTDDREGLDAVKGCFFTGFSLANRRRHTAVIFLLNWMFAQVATRLLRWCSVNF